MIDVSVDGLNAIIFTCGILALGLPLVLNDDVAAIDWISAKLLGEDIDESPPKKRERMDEGEKARVRNPLTGRWILYEGKTYKELAKKGIITDGTEKFETARVGLTWEFEETEEGSGIKPYEGSVVVLHHCTRLRSMDGPIVSTSITNVDASGTVVPFVFEVGDASVVRGLNEAVLGMREGGRGVLTLPPHMGFSSQRTEPAPSTAEARTLLNNAMRDAARPAAVVMDLHLLRVLAMPPQALSGTKTASVQGLQNRLQVIGDGEDFRLRAE